VSKQNLSNIIIYIIIINIFVEILQLLFSDESSVNEFMLFNVSVIFTQSIFLLRKLCHSIGHLRVQNSFDAPVHLPSFSPVKQVIYFTAVCVTATPLAEDLSGVIGKSKTEIPCQDYIPSWERRVGLFPHQPR